MNDPTEWPPELPAGENPPAGGIIDYYLARNVSGPVALDILDSHGKVVRSYSSDDPVIQPDPALHPAEYDKICQQDPNAPDCNVPLYWPEPEMVLSTEKGMHRFAWDLHFDPIGAESRAASGRNGVPYHTYPSVNAPWAPPGRYTVRLTVSGRQYTQPLALRLDPRVKIDRAQLEQLASLTREMYDGAIAAHQAYEDARAMVAKLDATKDAARIKEIEALAPAPRARGGRGGFGGFGGFFGRGPSGPPTLESVSSSMMSAAMSMQEADVAPTDRDVQACRDARAQYQEIMQKWDALKGSGM
jgi:hypothetical protein